MKYFLLLLLIFTNLTDVYSQQQRRRNNGQRNNRQGSAARNRNRAPRKPVVKPKVAKRPQKNPFILLTSNYSTWGGFLMSPEGGKINYSAIYYNKATRKFFYATMDEVSNIQYTFIPAKNNEVLVHPSIEEEALLYVGNLKPNQRILVNTNRNKFYMKTLTPIKDDTYLDNGDEVFANELPVLPLLNTLYEVQYTNTNGNLYNRVLLEGGVLRLLGDPPPDMKTVPSPILGVPQPKKQRNNRNNRNRQQQQRRRR